ncbi:hypothetical protein GO491_12110 [Flavobacteriaceae bacterium Ap0902]|nr:hypothetical protein [Flavobacteriaceae bacterium Ap0902]
MSLELHNACLYGWRNRHLYANGERVYPPKGHPFDFKHFDRIYAFYSALIPELDYSKIFTRIENDNYEIYTLKNRLGYNNFKITLTYAKPYKHIDNAGNKCIYIEHAYKNDSWNRNFKILDCRMNSSESYVDRNYHATNAPQFLNTKPNHALLTFTFKFYKENDAVDKERKMLFFKQKFWITNQGYYEASMSSPSDFDLAVKLSEFNADDKFITIIMTTNKIHIYLDGVLAFEKEISREIETFRIINQANTSILLYEAMTYTTAHLSSTEIEQMKLDVFSRINSQLK